MRIIAGLFGLSLVVAFIYGWIANIIWLIQQDMVFNVEQGLAIVGVFVAPLGAIMGFLH